MKSLKIIAIIILTIIMYGCQTTSPPVPPNPYIVNPGAPGTIKHPSTNLPEGNNSAYTPDASNQAGTYQPTSGIAAVPAAPVEMQGLQFLNIGVESPANLYAASEEIINDFTEWGIPIQNYLGDTVLIIKLNGKTFKKKSLGNFKNYEAQIRAKVIRTSDNVTLANRTVVARGQRNQNEELAKEGAFQVAGHKISKYLLEEVIKKGDYLLTKVIVISGLEAQPNLSWIINGLMTKPGIKKVRVENFNKASGHAVLKIVHSANVSDNIAYYLTTLPSGEQPVEVVNQTQKVITAVAK